MAFVTLGVVSNGWSALLPTSSLVEQCQQAVQAGFGYVELRQRALGSCEEATPGDDRPWPLPDGLANLAATVPELRYNLAVEAPFLTSTLAPDDPYLARCADAALALGGERPVLRLVDVSPAHSVPDHEEAIDELGRSVEEVARRLSRRGVALALENSRQPLLSLRAVVRRAAFGLPDDIPIPQICWDPHNQIAQTFLDEDPLDTAQTIGVEELFEFHFKQSRGGELQGDVGDGEIDWPAILAALHDRGYCGPALFELPAGPDIWERLDRSHGYIRHLLSRL